MADKDPRKAFMDRVKTDPNFVAEDEEKRMLLTLENLKREMENKQITIDAPRPEPIPEDDLKEIFSDTPAVAEKAQKKYGLEPKMNMTLDLQIQMAMALQRALKIGTFQEALTVVQDIDSLLADQYAGISPDLETFLQSALAAHGGLDTQDEQPGADHWADVQRTNMDSLRKQQGQSPFKMRPDPLDN